MTLLAAVLYMVVLLGCAYLFSRREGYYSSVTVFGLACFLYNVAIPVEVWFGRQDDVVIAGNLLRLDPLLQTRIILLAVLALLGFTGGYALSRFSPLTSTYPATGTASLGREVRYRAPRSFMLLVLGSVVMLAIFYREQILTAGTYAGSYSTTYANPIYSLLVKYASLGCTFIAAGLAAYRRWWASILFAMPLVCWGLYSSGKDPLLLALLALATPFVGMASRRLSKMVVICTASIALAAAAPPLFSQFRAGQSLDLERALSRGVFVRSDPAGPMVSLVDQLEGETSFRLGTTYVTAAILWVPRAIWRDRPLDLAEEFARERLSNWAPGRGLGYSLLAESYLNFGWPGALVQYGIIGLLWGLAWRIVQGRFPRRYPLYWRGMYFSLGYYTLVIMHRGATSSIVTSLIQILLPLMVALVLFDRRWRGEIGADRQANIVTDHEYGQVESSVGSQL